VAEAPAEEAPEIEEVEAPEGAETSKTLVPAVKLLLPTSGMAFLAGTPQQALSIAADPGGIERVDLMLGTTVVATTPGNGQPLLEAVQEWTPTDVGMLNVTVVAYDIDGNPSTFDTVQVAVVGPSTPVPTAAPTAVPPTPGPPDAGPPAVSITLETREAVTGQSVDLYVNAVDDTGVVTLEVYMNGEQVRVTPVDPVQKSVFRTYVWRSARTGRYDVFVRAIDTVGNVGQSVTERLRVSEPTAQPTADLNATEEPEGTETETPAP
jgi:hypothetical protein